jgi:hypothetical protein
MHIRSARSSTALLTIHIPRTGASLRNANKDADNRGYALSSSWLHERTAGWRSIPNAPRESEGLDVMDEAASDTFVNEFRASERQYFICHSRSSVGRHGACSHFMTSCTARGEQLPS